ncbi:hypothetical protein RJ639_006236 [Escallonia herrerae]|uniref:Uncharacterized protein n=1 Tax=Escallonia herrerae TaxID=1293975 RepID=A0AA88W0I2_9ASTE|nr:hypothetical protein RJ639_006236 [Escallonia herrerae]
MSLYVLFHMLEGKHGNLDLYRCCSLVVYSMLSVLIFSAVSLFIPKGGALRFALGAAFVLWSTRGFCSINGIGFSWYQC